MSSCETNERQSSMLILSRAIYARRSDDAFYPGTIQTKQPDGSYLVKFGGGTSERVVESDITWLGFWGLPPWMWPHNPIIQTAGPANMDFLNSLLGNDNGKERVSVSVPYRTLIGKGNEPSKRVNGFSQLLDAKSPVPTRSEMIPNGYVEELNAFEERSVHIQPKQSSESQTRTSVLRMCCTDENMERQNNRIQDDLDTTEDQLESPVFERLPQPTSRSDDRYFNFDEPWKTHKVKHDTPVRKRKMSEYEENSMKEKYARSKDIENRLQNSPTVEKHYPTVGPIPPLICPHYQNYDPPFGVSVYDAPSPPPPASFRLHRTRRRSENKKCRKVYGIENRDIWCTQCKWKKACTRFTNNDKVNRSELTYITDYEGLQYPV